MHSSAMPAGIDLAHETFGDCLTGDHQFPPTPMPCVTPLPPICSMEGRISGLSRNCWVTQISRPRRSTLMSARTGYLLSMEERTRARRGSIGLAHSDG